MAEIPEIETLRRQLDREIAGKKIKTVDVLDKSVVAKNSAGDLSSALDGIKIATVKRRARLLLVTLDSGDLLVFDVAKGGQLRRHQNKDAIADGTSIVFAFTQGGQLRLLAGGGKPVVFLTTPDELESLRPELTETGADLVETPVSWTVFARELVRHNDQIRQLLTDDRFIVGLGGLYADEILHSALLRYDRTPDSLTTQEIRRLYRSIVEVLHDSIKHGGTTLADKHFIDVHGEEGGFGQYLAVYDRNGERAPNGRGTVLRKKLGGQWVYYADYQV